MSLHSIPIPKNVNIVGIAVFTQGFRVEVDNFGNLDVSALNAIDLVLGT